MKIADHFFYRESGAENSERPRTVVRVAGRRKVREVAEEGGRERLVAAGVAAGVGVADDALDVATGRRVI
jgi:hypothetical protein